MTFKGQFGRPPARALEMMGSLVPKLLVTMGLVYVTYLRLDKRIIDLEAMPFGKHMNQILLTGMLTD